MGNSVTYLTAYDGAHISPDGKSQWELWSENCDRMRGMISLRFINFRSRGYGASPQTIEHNVRWLAQQPDADIALTMKTFLKRKVVVKATAKADKKLATFKTQLVADFDAALGQGKGTAWFEQHVAPIAQKLRDSL
jgi:hypothetical protein|eukprot:COSAG06_NODE_9464_length_1893_cov_33.974359_2_plen_136_part_00